MTKRRLLEYLLTGQLTLFLIVAPFMPRFHESIAVEGILVGLVFFTPVIIVHLVLPASFTFGESKPPRG